MYYYNMIPTFYSKGIPESILHNVIDMNETTMKDRRDTTNRCNISIVASVYCISSTFGIVVSVHILGIPS